jgi:diguanylate cyclase (GGDEF)-like protein
MMKILIADAPPTTPAALSGLVEKMPYAGEPGLFSRGSSNADGKHKRSIRWKLAAAFIAVACFVAAFVGFAIAIHFETVKRAAQLEAEHVAELIADAAIENNTFTPRLQEYLTRLNAVRKRDIVIVDAVKKGLADVDPDEVGKIYDHDYGNEVAKTISDGQTRTFIEKNDLHPDGAHQIVVPLRQSGPNLTKAAIGAVILEYTPIREELFAAERDELYLITAAGIGVVLLTTFFGLGIARRIAQPLRELKSSVERIAAQDYAARVVVTSHDEIGLLGSAFNKMAEDLNVSHAEVVEHKRELERRVAARTQELDQSNTLLQQEVRQHQLVAERAEYLAYYDVLTGLANRALFHERLEQSVVNANEQGRKLALVLLDIERFKTINDTLGRQAGDALLKDLAVRLLGHAAEVGRLARIDADHFAVMVPEVQTEEEVARLIEQRVGEVFDPPFRIGNSELRVSAKYGIAMFPGDGADADTLFRNAEAALKKAKASGNRYLFYTQTMNERVAEKLTLENQLRRALDKEEFVLHYQPKVNLQSGKLTSAEALIRWNDPRTGLVPPGRFIPILEETGLIYAVGRWALRKAIEDYLRWHTAGLVPVRIAVNVSPLQLRDRGFIAEIERAIAIDAQAAAGLELEFTESMIMEDVKHSIATLQAIRAMGVTIAIDAFGTGLSSLGYLAKLPVDTLKIDRSFVNDMTVAPEGLALVSTFINLAHSLKLKVVAEGVETEEQSRLLRLLSCDEMQGLLFSKPVPTEIFETRFLAPPTACDLAVLSPEPVSTNPGHEKNS